MVEDLRRLLSMSWWVIIFSFLNCLRRSATFERSWSRLSVILVIATASTAIHPRLIWYGVRTDAYVLQVEFRQRKLSPPSPRGQSRLFKVSAEAKHCWVSQCDRRQWIHFVFVATGCELWCASHKQPWKSKCTWSGRCDGCFQCLLGLHIHVNQAFCVRLSEWD